MIHVFNEKCEKIILIINTPPYLARVLNILFLSYQKYAAASPYNVSARQFLTREHNICFSWRNMENYCRFILSGACIDDRENVCKT